MITLGLCVLLGLHAVNSPPVANPPSGRTPPPAAKADAATLALARTLTAEFQKERYFSDATLERPGSLAALGYLALTSKEAPLVQRAYENIGKGLDALASGDKDPRTASALAIEAIMAGIGRSERPILDKALGAASQLNMGREAHQPSLQAIADLALKHREPDVRYAALSALYQVGPFVASRSQVLPETMAVAMGDPSEGIVYMNMLQFNTMGRLSPAFAARHARISASFKRLRSQGSPLMRAAAIGATAKMLYPGIELPGMPRRSPGRLQWRLPPRCCVPSMIRRRSCAAWQPRRPGSFVSWRVELRSL